MHSFIILPSLRSSVTQDDNVFPDSGNKRSDTIISVRPEVDIESDWNNHALNLSLAAEVGRYSSFSNENYEDFELGINGRTDFSRVARLYSGFSFDRLHEGRESADSSNGGEPTIYSDMRAYAEYRQTLNRVNYQLRGVIQELDYDDVSGSGVTINNDDRDRRILELGGKIAYEFEAQYAGFAELIINERNYSSTPDDDGFNRDSSGYELNVGVEAALSGVSRASAYIGYVSQDPADARFSNVEGTSLGGDFTWNLSALTAIRFTLEQSTEETTLASAGALQNHFGVRADHELLRNLILYAAWDSFSNDYEDIDREDKDSELLIGANYMANRSLYFLAEIRRDKRDSSGANNGVNFTRQQVEVSARLNL